jgi:glycerol-3-phosphate dehydrogenase subunit B
MAKNNPDTCCDLLIIGAGVAGLTAALFAARHAIETVLVGMNSEIGFASGLLDLLGVHPLADGHILDNPWEGIVRLRREEPEHPYARLDPADIRHAMETVTAFFKENGYPYEAHPQRNVQVITPVGTLKPTWAIPHTMHEGPQAMSGRKKCLLVDLAGLKGFSAQQIAQSICHRWPEITPTRINFPDINGDLYAEQIGWALDLQQTRAKLVDAIRPHLSGAEVVGLPAVLGVHHTVNALQDLSQGLGVPVFEVPTMLPAVTGLRLQHIFAENLPPLGPRLYYPEQVAAGEKLADGRWSLTLAGDRQITRRIKARCLVLCTGRFFSQGLRADRQQIYETIFDLPVTQPADRSQWHQKHLFHRCGHPINRAGLAVDDSFRPVDRQGRTIHENLFTAGIILAHQDWMRQKCGCGLSIATAYGAIKGCLNFLKGAMIESSQKPGQGLHKGEKPNG